MSRRCGANRDETPPEDDQRIAEFAAKLSMLKATANRIREQRNLGQLEGIPAVVKTEILPVPGGVQRVSFTVIQSIEARMADTAKTTTAAFLASHQQVIAAALVAIGLALPTGYAKSSALIWPVRRIGEVLHRVSGGGFDARVNVPNRDDFGGLAHDVNAMSARLGAAEPNPVGPFDPKGIGTDVTAVEVKARTEDL